MSNLWVFNEDKSGLTYALADEILQDYTNLFKQIFPDINTEPSTAIGQIISALAQDDITLIDKMRETSNYFFNGGSGLMLDIWAYNNFRIIRKSAIPSNVIVTIYGQPKTKIPKGFIVSDGKLQYYTELDYIIPLNGELDVLCVAKEVYSQASLANTITQIITPIQAVDRVNNSNPSNVGLNKETDSQLFLRCMELGSTFRNASLRSILANISQLDNVIKVGGFENRTNKEITERNVKIPPHSFIAVVLGGDDKAIGESISYSKPVGAGTTGNTPVEILVNEKPNTYYFERPSYLALKVSVVCKLSLVSPKSYIDIVKEAVLQYVDKLEIGDYITQPSLSQAISSQAYNFEIVDVKFGTKAREVISYEKFTSDMVTAFIPYTEVTPLYTYSGDDPAPTNYVLYQSTQGQLYTKNANKYVEFKTNLYTKTNGNDDPNMAAFNTPLFYKKNKNLLYEKTGGGSMPTNYQEYTPSEALFFLQNDQYQPFTKKLYILTNGSESGEMTLIRGPLYTKKVEVIGGDVSYNPIQLDLNQLALINSNDISVTG